MVHFSGADIFLFVVGFFLPPVAVVLKQGCGCEFLISIGLTLLGHVPGIVYAWYIVYENRDDLTTHRHRHNGHTYVAVPAQQHPNYQATAAAAPPVQHPVS